MSATRKEAVSKSFFFIVSFMLIGRPSEADRFRKVF